MDNEFAYDRPEITDFKELPAEHRKVLEWVGPGKKVLELGCHTGYFSNWLRKQGCKVTGVDVFGPALEKAGQHLDRVIAGDLESAQCIEQIEEEKYDVVLFMHILEHLADPERLLKRSKDWLLPGGMVIICLPNISNWADRWLIFKGNFRYTETGVMDKTHLRFYNYHTARELITNCGFSIAAYSGQSWKVVFRFLPEMKGTGRLNAVFNRAIHKISKPNFTDKVTMFKAVPDLNHGSR